MSKPGSGEAKTRSYRGGKLLVGVLLRGDQVDQGDAPVLVGLSKRYASIHEAAAQRDVPVNVARVLREENVERVRSVRGAGIENAIAV